MAFDASKCSFLQMFNDAFSQGALNRPDLKHPADIMQPLLREP